MEYSGPINVLIRTLIEKRYALPSQVNIKLMERYFLKTNFKVIESIINYFYKSINKTTNFPVFLLLIKKGILAPNNFIICSNL
jgi:hypothetical protein